MKDHIIPALQSGRKVVAYIEGLDHQKIAEVAGIGLDKCKELLRPITREEVFILPTLDYTDSLVVIDELQNFWPAGRATLPDDVVQLITEHRHRGADILAMGQCLQDCHTMWRRRVARKYVFVQKDALGKPNEYKVIVYKGVLGGGRGGDVRFEELSSESHEYDTKYFGTYASHTDDAENKETLMDRRAVIWNNKIFRRWLPLFAISLVGALGYLVHFFTGGLSGDVSKKKDQAVKPAPVAVASAPAQVVTPPKSVAPPSPSVKWDGPDLVKVLADKATPRLAGLVLLKGAIDGRIDWVGQNGITIQSLTFADLAALGYSVMVNASGTLAIMRRGDYMLPASSYLVMPVVKS